PAELEVARRTGVVEAVRLVDPPDLVAQPTDLARERTRVVDVTAAVQDVDRELPRRRQRLARTCSHDAARPAPSAEAAEQRDAERGEDDDCGGRGDDPRSGKTVRPRGDRHARPRPGLVWTAAASQD